MLPNSSDESKIRAVVLESMRIVNMSRSVDKQLELSDQAALYGSGGPLDSLGLVALLIEIEEALAEEGIDVSLSDERAMAQRDNPFSDVPTLVAYIERSLSLSIE